MPKLTARQQEILDLIRQAIRLTGFPPTRAEIAKQLGFRSPNAAEEHLKALARKGVLELSACTSRGIRLTAEPVVESSIPAAVAQLMLPLVGRVAAGSPILAAEHIDKSIGVDEALFSMRPDYLLKVRGLSMRDAGILEGDLLAVKKTTEARDGQIIVARLGDEVTVKRLKHTSAGLQLLPENPDFQPIEVSRDRDDFAVEGIAVGLIRAGILH